jgi:amidase
MADELWQLSACELAAGIRQKRFSCLEVMEAVTGRIRALNPGLNAIVYDYSDDALAEARRADEELASGRASGPLHGVPVTVKSNVDQKGKPPPNGISAFEKPAGAGAEGRAGRSRSSPCGANEVAQGFSPAVRVIILPLGNP